MSLRARERCGSAALRAVAIAPTAEYRAQHLTVGDSPLPIATPYLAVDLTNVDQRRDRGVVDALAVRLRFSDRQLHERLAPTSIVARLTFDILEQVRCEALVPDELVGVRRNIEAAFREWCAEEVLTESDLGLLLYTVLHMARSRLVHPIQTEHIEDTIEATRANIAPIVGSALRQLGLLVESQTEYSVPALEIAATVAAMVEDRVPGHTDDFDSLAARLFIPPEWGDEPIDEPGDSPVAALVDRVDARSADEVGDYHVFTTEYDVEVDGASLYPDHVRQEARASLDELIADQSMSVFALARRLQHLLIGFERDGWTSGEDDGILDPARLALIVANPAERHVFRRERVRPVSPAVVTFLVDNSGSMKRQRYEAVAVLVDTLARALDLAGATSEVLGYTTRSWNGGEPLREWRRAGEPEDPGRVAELCHIVYKDAETSWKRSRSSIASMMKTRHFRESVDGEALAWAYRRLLARPEPRKLLVVIGDGAPMEAATMNANGEAFLEAHLRNVSARIDSDGAVELGAIAIDVPVDEFFAQWVELDVTGTLTLGAYRVLESLFRSP